MWEAVVCIDDEGTWDGMKLFVQHVITPGDGDGSGLEKETRLSQQYWKVNCTLPGM